MFSQLVEICRQLVESRTVIPDTRRNIVVNSSELGFNIVSCRSNSYASRSNSSELGFNIVLSDFLKKKIYVWFLTLYAFIISKVIIRTQNYTNASLISAPVVISYQNV